MRYPHVDNLHFSTLASHFHETLFPQNKLSKPKQRPMPRKLKKALRKDWNIWKQQRGGSSKEGF